MTTKDRHLEAARQIAHEIARHLEADLSLELWNGEVIPLGPNARRDVRIAVRSPDTVRRLLLSPNLVTVFALYGDGSLDIKGASPLEASRRWDHMKAVRLPRTVSKARLLKAALPFLLWRAPADTTLPAFTDKMGAYYGRDRKDADMVQFHYDASNAFYELFLDREMVYSAGYFPTPETTLDGSQDAKLDRICKKLMLAPGKTLLDIGCGWGGLAAHAALHYGVKVHGVTLSKQQYEYATEKMRRLGLADRVTIELKDYREITSPRAFDAIAQVEMFEHVGLDNHDRHFRHIHSLLKPRGTYLHQAMTRRAPMQPKGFRRRTVYAKALLRYIFPGYELDHIGNTTTNLERHGFEVHDVENMREHYHLTLEHWAARLWAKREAADALVGRQRTRLWLMYLTMVCRGFERGPVLVYQTLATRRASGLSGLPLARADLFATQDARKIAA